MPSGTLVIASRIARVTDGTRTTGVGFYSLFPTPVCERSERVVKRIVLLLTVTGTVRSYAVHERRV